MLRSKPRDNYYSFLVILRADPVDVPGSSESWSFEVNVRSSNSGGMNPPASILDHSYNFRRCHVRGILLERKKSLLVHELLAIVRLTIDTLIKLSISVLVETITIYIPEVTFR